MKLSQLLKHLEGEVISVDYGHQLQPDSEILGVAAIDHAEVGQLSFVESKRYAKYMAQTKASILIIPADPEVQATASELQLAWIATPHPRLLFAQAIALFYRPHQPVAEIHPTAVIHPSVQIGQAVAIGAHVTIQADVELGDRVVIHPNVVIYPQVVVGDRTELHANSVIHERTQIGRDCVIHSGAVIGSEGFGFVPTATGWYKMPQSGYTVLEDGVEVGCNSTIDRPAVGETRVKQGSKIDNLVQVAHGCQIGHQCVLAAQVGLAGRVSLGDGVVLAGQVGIADQVQVASGVIATAQSGISHDIPKNTVVSGYPATNNRLWLKASAIYRRLPEMYQRLQQLQHQVQQLIPAEHQSVVQQPQEAKVANEGVSPSSE